ncbi:MAG: MotA/TolQ/ExbB proton channel family protein [Defluviitaleaceae bacterium]|nr:MotA/TolQ/ExbB proton channel family protein [Defluviitaleaceae bacterium]
MYVRGILVFMAMIVCAVLFAIELDMYMLRFFFDSVTLVVFILAIVGAITAAGGFKTFVSAVNALLSRKYHISASDKEKSIRLFKLIKQTVFYTSLIITMVGIINMLANLNDPSMLGANVAVCIVSIYYGLIINMVFIHPAINLLETRYNTEEKTVISEKQVIDKLLELCYKQGISPEEILNASEMNLIKRQ